MATFLLSDPVFDFVFGILPVALPLGQGVSWTTAVRKVAFYLNGLRLQLCRCGTVRGFGRLYSRLNCDFGAGGTVVGLTSRIVCPGEPCLTR